MLTAIETYSKDTEINKDYITNFVKSAVSFTNGKSDLKITGPSLDRSKLLELFGDDKPIEQIIAAYKKEDGEEEGDALCDKLIEVIQKTPSIIIYKEFAAASG